MLFGVIEDGLMGFYSKIQNAVQTSCSRDNANVTIMIDDISLLEIAARGSEDDVLDFLHYCVTLTSELVRKLHLNLFDIMLVLFCWKPSCIFMFCPSGLLACDSKS